MIRSYKNKEFISSLNNKELRDYYGCLAHHSSNRKNCCQESSHSFKQFKNCPCTCIDSNETNHFCTGSSVNSSQITSQCSCNSGGCQFCRENSLTVCENYKPSYTTKDDQIKYLKREVGLMRRCKSTLHDAMKDLDKLLDESEAKEVSNRSDGSGGLDSVEKFYRSKKFIGSSMNIKSLREYVPRTDISRWTYEVDLKDMSEKEDPSLAAPLFGFFRSRTFMDQKILKNEDIKRSRQQPVELSDKPAASAIVYIKKNSPWRP